MSNNCMQLYVHVNKAGGGGCHIEPSAISVEVETENQSAIQPKNPGSLMCCKRLQAATQNPKEILS